jgi:hypothetical protein
MRCRNGYLAGAGLMSQVIVVPETGDGAELLWGNTGYTDLMVDGAPSPHQSDTTLRWLIDRLRS